MGWTALGLVALAIVLAVAFVYVGGNAKAADGANRAALLAVGAIIAFVAFLAVGGMALLK